MADRTRAAALIGGAPMSAVHVAGVKAWDLPTPGLDPFSALGSAVAQVAGDAWMVAMVALWSAGLWMLRMAFLVVDALTVPDLSADGPLRPVLQTTLWLGGVVAVLMLFVQLVLLLVRRDGASLGRLLLGVFQFGFVWIAFLACAGGAVAACSGLSKGILRATLHVDALSAIDWTSSMPRNVVDVTAATVLGLTSILLIIPGAFMDVLVAFVGEAALLVLVATSPITAAGLLHETSRAWWWKALRWFTACVLIGPTTALVFGVGVGIAKGIVYGNGDQTVAAVGTAVVGGALVVVGACCPLALFRLLAFIDPSTPSGAALRQSWADAGRAAGLPTSPVPGPGGGQSGGLVPGGGSSKATAGDGAGRAQGEATAEATTSSRVTSMLGVAGRGMQVLTGFATRATDLSADILGATGVGSPAYSMTPADERALRGNTDVGGRPDGGSDPGGGSGDGGSSGGGKGGGSTPSGPAPTSPVPVPPSVVPPGAAPPGTPPGPASGPTSGGSGQGPAGPVSGGQGGAGPAADAAGAAGSVPVIVP